MKYTDPEAFCVVTGERGVDLHHIKTRGSGGTDDAWNLIPLTHRLHVEVHAIGLNKFAEKYPPAKAWLLCNAWELEAFRNRWVHE